MNKSRSGFTIVELLIVIVVIGILAAITIVAYRGMQQRATTAAVTSAVDHWEKVMRMEIANSGELPPMSAKCLGSSESDFPATSDFLKGQCMHQTMGGAETSWLYSEDDFATWQVSRPSGRHPKTSLTLNDGDTRIRARGIIAWSSPTTKTAFIQWIPQVADECGRGEPVVPDNDLSGGLCMLSIEY